MVHLQTAALPPFLVAFLFCSTLNRLLGLGVLVLLLLIIPPPFPSDHSVKPGYVVGMSIYLAGLLFLLNSSYRLAAHTRAALPFVGRNSN